MKKLKNILGAFLRLIVILAPLVLITFYYWAPNIALLAILAAVGAETLWLILLGLILTGREVWKRKHGAREPETDGLLDDDPDTDF